MAIGVSVSTSELALSGGVPTTTGTAFFAGNTDGGSATAGTLCRSISDFLTSMSTQYLGRTTFNATMYDTVDTFFREGGQQCYVVRDVDGTEVAATLTLQDSVPHPTVVVTSKYSGAAGNNYNVVVTQANAPTFTMTTTNSSANVTAVSSFANIAAGTPISGTNIAANTYVASVNVAASTLVLSIAATGSSSPTVTPVTFTVQITDPTGVVLETHGPFINTAALYADTTSTIVTFAQSAGGGFTIMSPKALTQTTLATGANGTPTDANAVTALASFASTLGPGTVALPGRANTTAWNGLLAHAAANNRFAALDMADSTSTSTLVTATGTTSTNANASYGAFFTSTAVIPGLTAGTTRTVPASAVVAALRAQVAATGNDNQMPAGANWPLVYVSSFTNEAFATFGQSGINTLQAAGINTFALYQAKLCLFGFQTPVPSSTEPIFWQANCSCERMSLVANAAQLAGPFLFQAIDGQQLTLTHLQGQLQGMIAKHWQAKALYGANATDAGSVNVLAPVNTTATAQAGQLNAQLQVRLTPSALTVPLGIQFVPVTQTITQTG